MPLVGEEGTEGGGTEGGREPPPYLALAEFSLIVVTASQGNTNLASDALLWAGAPVRVLLWTRVSFLEGSARVGGEVPTAQYLTWEIWL